eukprot:6425982-Pyramimonas_sp.AAC.1
MRHMMDSNFGTQASRMMRNVIYKCSPWSLPAEICRLLFHPTARGPKHKDQQAEFERQILDMSWFSRRLRGILRSIR